MKHRVVVTGIGAITPVGNNVNDMWNSIKNGVSGINYIQGFDAEDFKVKIAAELKDFKPEDYFDRKECRRLDRFTQIALVAADEAMKQSGLNLDEIDRTKMGVIIGSGIGGMQTIEKEHNTLIERGPSRVSPYYIPMAILNMAAGNIAIKYGCKGTCTTVVTACASGTNAVGEAFRAIQRGELDIMVTGGSEASITPLSMSGFISLSALSTSTDLNRASIPFDAERNGFVMGEGAGILILEEYEHAIKRGATIIAEMTGYGSTCDAHHITAPAPDGEGAARAMALAIKDSEIEKEEITYINAHGTSTAYNDKFETAAVKKLFGDYAYKIPVSSTKSMTGHLLGAAGAVEAIICVKALQEGFIPPTANLNVKDAECDLDYVPNVGRESNLQYAMSNSLGFGGHNASVVFKKFSR